MDNLKKLELALKKSQSAVYHWNTEDDSLTWEGDISWLSKADVSTGKKLEELVHEEDKGMYEDPTRERLPITPAV